mgnify:FL=1
MEIISASAARELSLNSSSVNDILQKIDFAIKASAHNGEISMSFQDMGFEKSILSDVHCAVMDKLITLGYNVNHKDIYDGYSLEVSW